MAKQPTAAESAAITAVYQKLGELQNTLRDARIRIHHAELLAVINEQIDYQLAADDRLRKAIVETTGKPVEDPY